MSGVSNPGVLETTREVKTNYYISDQNLCWYPLILTNFTRETLDLVSWTDEEKTSLGELAWTWRIPSRKEMKWW